MMQAELNLLWNAVAPILGVGTDTLSAWFLTYWIHSTLLLLTAALTTQWVARELALREAIWKVALFGGIVTASLQVTLGVEPVSGAWTVGPAASESPAAPVTNPLRALERSPDTTADLPAYFVPTGRRVDREPAVAATPAVEVEISRFDAARRVFALAWALVGAALLASLGSAYARLRRRLAKRRALENGTERDALDRLVGATSSQRATDLFASEQIAIPLANGVRRREIFLPERSLSEMTPERRELVLAHELAHLERRDPAWLIATRIVEAALFAQPLNRMARRELQEIAEYRADDWAVARTGRPLGLAKCLAEVAEWSAEPAAWETAPAMADGSPLSRRVSRLLSRDYPRPENPTPRWLGVAAAALLGALVLVAPGVRPSEAASEEVAPPQESTQRPEPTEAPAAPEPSPAPEPAPTPTPSPTPSPAPAPLPEAAAVPRPVAPAAPPVAPLPPEEVAAWTAHLSELAQLGELEASRLTELAQKLVEQSIPNPAELDRLQALATKVAARALGDRDLHAEISAQALDLAANWRELTEEERLASQERLRELAEQIQPSELELAELERAAEAIAIRSELSAAERERIEEQIQREMEVVERRLESEMRRFETERRRIESKAREMESEARRLEIERERIEREVEIQQREIEREIRQREREIEEKVRTQQREIERHRKKLEEEVREREERLREREEELRGDGANQAAVEGLLSRGELGRALVGAGLLEAPPIEAGLLERELVGSGLLETEPLAVKLDGRLLDRLFDHRSGLPLLEGSRESLFSDDDC